MTTDSTEQLRTTLAALDISSEIAEIARDPCRYGGIADIYQGLRMSRFGITSQVAIKFIRSDKKEFEKMLRRYRREIRVWQRIDHPNVLPLLGLYWGARPLPALVSPWCEHGSIRTYFQTLPAGVDVLQKKHISLQEIARGLAYLHSYTPPVIHGDLKGDNILVSDRGVARICDFGLSRIKALTTDTLTTIRGTLRWMAPELLEDDARTTTATDVWAYACVMIEIFSGNSPYSEKASDQAIITLTGFKPVLNSSEVRYRALVRGELPARPDGMSDACWSLALRCLAPVPEKRPSSDHIVTDPLFDGFSPDDAILSAEDTDSSAFIKPMSVDLDRQMLIHSEHPVNYIPCDVLIIGNWRSTARNDLLAYSCDAKRCVTWFIQSTGFSYKMEIPYDVITRVEFTPVPPLLEVAQVTFDLCGVPTFFASPSSGVELSWQNCQDWTEGGQASTVVRHDIYGPLTQMHASLSHTPLGPRMVRLPAQPLYESEMPLEPELPSPPLMTLPTSSSIPMGFSPTHSIPTSSASNVPRWKQKFTGPPPHSQGTHDVKAGQLDSAAPSARSNPEPTAKQILNYAALISAMAAKIRVKGAAMQMLVEKACIYATQIDIAVEGRILDASLQRRLERVYSVFLEIIEVLVHAKAESRVLALLRQKVVSKPSRVETLVDKLEREIQLFHLLTGIPPSPLVVDTARVVEAEF